MARFRPIDVFTLSGNGEAYLLSQIWHTPTAFPTLFDPGPAISWFPLDLRITYLSESGTCPNTAHAIFAYIKVQRDRHSIHALRQITIDIIEYGPILQMVTLQESRGVSVVSFVTRWASLRRYALVLQLMSINALRDPLLHSIRIALLIWLAVVSDFAGSERSLEIMATHLLEILQLIPNEIANRVPELMSWIALLGAMVAKPQAVAEAFMQILCQTLLSKIGGCSSVVQWFYLLENVSKNCFYCHILQRQGLWKLAGDLHSYWEQPALEQ